MQQNQDLWNIIRYHEFKTENDKYKLPVKDEDLLTDYSDTSYPKL